MGIDDILSVPRIDLHFDEELSNLWVVVRKAGQQKSAFAGSVSDIRAIYDVEGDAYCDVDQEMADFFACSSVCEPVPTTITRPKPVIVPSHSNFQFDVETTFRNLFEQRTIHEWTVKELRSVCCGHSRRPGAKE